MPETPQNARILILRLSSMGDVIHAMPAVAALRAAHPEAYIAWAIEPAWAPLLFSGSDHPDQHPLVDAIHLVPFKKWTRQHFSVATLKEVLATRRELAAAKYDVALDMQGSLRSAVTMRWTHAPRQLGEDKPREAIARHFYKERIAHTGAHVIEQDLELASAIFGESLTDRPPPFPFDADAEQWADDLLAKNPASRYAMLLPGAGWGTKRWPSERFGSVGYALGQLGFHSFFNVGPGEEKLGHLAETASGHTATSLATTIPQLIALLRRTALCIGGDTGPLHLASALEVPIVGIYGPTDPARNGPYHAPHRVLRHPDSQRDHARKDEPERGLLTITPQDVIAAVHELLEEGQL